MNAGRFLKQAALGVPLAVALGCAAFPDADATRGVAEKMVAAAYPGMPASLTKRAAQDRSQQLCSKIGGATLAQAEAAEVVKLARASIRYPESGKLVGDWKIGAKLAYTGNGSRILGGKLEKAKQNGGLCSNCHMLDPRELNVGNIGPSLTGYGAQRGNSGAIARLTYDRIYNGWAYAPCSNMPRLGANGHLTPEQITHLVAYLIDPASPINSKR